MSNVVSIPSTRDRVLDTLLVYAIMDIGLEVDPDIRFRVTLGQENFITVNYSNSNLERDMLSKLKDKSKRFSIADRMNFFLNMGNTSWKVDKWVCTYCTGKNDCNRNGDCGKTNILAYAVLHGYIKSMGSFSLPWSPKSITKAGSRGRRCATLSVGVSPYWSKGIRRWDMGEWREDSTTVEHSVLPFALYGLGNYTINVVTGNMLIRLMFSPPVGRELSHLEAIKLLTLVRRVVNSIYIEMQRFFRLEFPSMVLPLSMLCFLDVPAIYMLHQFSPSILLISYDLYRNSPKNPRGYEELSLADALEFYRQIGESFWDFKKMIIDLVSLAEREEYRSRVFDILIKLALGIKNKEPSYFNDALLNIQSLRKEVNVKFFVIGREEMLAAHRALRTSH
ncbi:MAG: hypothetical protein QXN15_11300 [Candidatus Jordarchaeales archaeon]|nr:hypothetical protein [Candidatus Jordarchaeia archaeon]